MPLQSKKPYFKGTGTRSFGGPFCWGWAGRLRFGLGLLAPSPLFQILTFNTIIPLGKKNQKQEEKVNLNN